MAEQFGGTRFLASPKKLHGQIHREAAGRRDERQHEERVQHQIEQQHVAQREAVLAGRARHHERNRQRT